LKAPAEITARHSVVELLSRNAAHSDTLSARLAQAYDLERISGRVHARLAAPRDTYALGRTLAELPVVAETLGKLEASGAAAGVIARFRTDLARVVADSAPLHQRILSTQREEAPFTARDGGIFKTGTTPELDRLLTLTEDGERWLVELETRERAATGISSLKVRYNRVFGYYIEVTAVHLKNVPAHYQRKQTMVGAERFFTEELKKFEEEILTASAKRKALEQEIFENLLEEVRAGTPAVMEAARLIAELDAWLSLAVLGRQSGWVFPTIDDSLDLDIRAGRHPLVDAASRGSFVPNDLELSPETRLTLLITGPNMGGKSTVMRQTALIVLLGQIGGPVPAAQASWGAVSSLYTRIGANDAIARGQSTFMVEMSELAHILHHADERSLIILDEIGRGTSTYDGMSVAWSTLEWISARVKSRTLFATHYHELTRLASQLPAVANAHMAVEGTRSLSSGSLRFLYLLREGPANESFGVHVARLAGLPRGVIERAWKILEELEAGSVNTAAPDRESSQLSLFDAQTPKSAASSESALALAEAPPAEPHPVLVELDTVDVNAMTPMQALNWVAKLQSQYRGAENAT
jgi:DNA mismatch repair protein MutS